MNSQANHAISAHPIGYILKENAFQMKAGLYGLMIQMIAFTRQILNLTRKTDLKTLQFLIRVIMMAMVS